MIQFLVVNCKGCGRKRSWLNVRDYAGICMKELVETTKKNSVGIVDVPFEILVGHLPNISPNEVITTAANLVGKSDY